MADYTIETTFTHKASVSKQQYDASVKLFKEHGVCPGNPCKYSNCKYTSHVRTFWKQGQHDIDVYFTKEGLCEKLGWQCSEVKALKQPKVWFVRVVGGKASWARAEGASDSSSSTVADDASGETSDVDGKVADIVAALSCMGEHKSQEQVVTKASSL